MDISHPLLCDRRLAESPALPYGDSLFYICFPDDNSRGKRPITVELILAKRDGTPRFVLSVDYPVLSRLIREEEQRCGSISTARLVIGMRIVKDRHEHYEKSLRMRQEPRISDDANFHFLNLERQFLHVHTNLRRI